MGAGVGFDEGSQDEGDLELGQLGQLGLGLGQLGQLGDTEGWSGSGGQVTGGGVVHVSHALHFFGDFFVSTITKTTNSNKAMAMVHFLFSSNHFFKADTKTRNVLGGPFPDGSIAILCLLLSGSCD